MAKTNRPDSGYEYEVVRLCPRTGRPVLAPKFWTAVRTPRIPNPRSRPWYPTCACCRLRG